MQSKITIAVLFGVFFVTTLLFTQSMQYQQYQVTFTGEYNITAMQGTVDDSVKGDTIYGKHHPPRVGDSISVYLPNGWYIYICSCCGRDYAVYIENNKIKIVGGGPDWHIECLDQSYLLHLESMPVIPQ